MCLFVHTYRIRPNYRTVRSGFSKLLGTLSCDKICIYLLRIHYKKIRKGLTWWWLCDFFSDFLFKSICCGYSFELHRQVDAIQMSAHNICLYKEVKKKRTLAVIWRLRNDCALIGVCVVIRLNTVFSFPNYNMSKYQWIPTKLGKCIDIVET